MILFDIKKLIHSLKEDSLPQKHFFYYFIIYSIFTSLSGLSLPGSSSEELWSDNVSIIISTVISLAFIIHYYKLCYNAGKASKFFEYYFSIGFVFGLRFVVYCILLAIPIGILVAIFTWQLSDGLMTEIEKYAYLVYVPIIVIIYSFLFLKQFKRVLA